MAKVVQTQMNEFRKLDDGRIVLDGLVYDSNPDKAIDVLDPDNGLKVHSIRINEIYYYPIGYDKRKNK